jgi:hypothetical protein
MTILIPGTDWQRHGGWSLNSALFGCANTPPLGGPVRLLYWCGRNSDAARVQAARRLRRSVASHLFAPGEPLNVIGHSHGGNVALAASHLGLGRAIDLLITLNKPTRRGKAYVPGPNIRQFYNLSARRDGLQWFGSDAKWRHATDPHAINHVFDTSASPLKPHAALIWDDDFRAIWWKWLRDQPGSTAAESMEKETAIIYGLPSSSASCGQHPDRLATNSNRLRYEGARGRSQCGQWSRQSRQRLRA